MEGSSQAGALFPQPVVTVDGVTVRMDDVLGEGAWLITATPAQVAGPDVTAVGLDDRRVAIFREALAAWLTGNGVEAVLVRPDRPVFGAGEARHLLRAWSQALGAPSSTAMALA